MSQLETMEMESLFDRLSPQQQMAEIRAIVSGLSGRFTSLEEEVNRLKLQVAQIELEDNDDTNVETFTVKTALNEADANLVPGAGGILKHYCRMHCQEIGWVVRKGMKDGKETPFERFPRSAIDYAVKRYKEETKKL